MARKPKNTNHPIRKLRGVIGKLQYEFAAMIGITADYLKKIENGERAFRTELAKQIGVATGVDDRALLKGQVRNVFGGEYTAEFCDDWRAPMKMRGDGKRYQAVVEGGIIAPIEIILRAARDKGDFWSVIAWFEQRLDECRDLFRLKKRTDAIMSREIEPKLREISRRWKRNYPSDRYGYSQHELMAAFRLNRERRRSLRAYRACRHNKSRVASRR